MAESAPEPETEEPWPISRPEFTESDRLEYADDPRGALELVTKMDDLETSAEAQWRVARCYSALGDFEAKGSAEMKAQFSLGLAAAEKAVALDETNPYGHKWYALMLGQMTQARCWGGTKEKIEQSYILKEEATLALQQLPKDSSLQYLLGNWCLSVADLSWIERKAASAFFATPPESSYEEALGYLLSAAENRENWIRCAKLIGDVYIKLVQPSEAKDWYGKAMAMPASKNAAEAAAQADAAARHKEL
jgi:hypothetical protein